MAGANSHMDIEKECADSARFPWERRLLLSTSYPLSASNSERIQIGLRATGRCEHPFEPAIELSGSRGEGIEFDFYSWLKFKNNMALVGSYLRGDTVETPQGVLLNENALNFTTSHGTRAIILIPRTSTLEKNTDSVILATEVTQPIMKKQKLDRRGIMLRRDTFEELVNIVECIGAKHSQLELLEEDVEECARSLMWHIGHRLHKLPEKVNVDSGLVRKILTDNYRDIKISMRRVIEEESEFFCRSFDVLFSELTTIYFNYISQSVIRDYFICNSMK